MNETEFREKYYPLAKKQTVESLPKFIEDMLKETMDYGSICCAVSAGALAAAYAINESPQGGITGFQAGAVMWEFIRQWLYSSNKIGLKLVDYDKMIYSQYESDFTEKTITKSMFENLKKEAQRLLDEDIARYKKYLEDNKQYDIDIVNFTNKYPDYKTNPDKYIKLTFATGKQFAEQEAKEKAGFEFAPAKPVYFQGQTEHWLSIVNGQVPFGYSIKGE